MDGQNHRRRSVRNSRRRSSTLLSSFFYYPLDELVDDPSRMWLPEYDLKAGPTAVFLTELVVQIRIQWEYWDPVLLLMYFLYYVLLALLIAFSTYERAEGIRFLNTQLKVLVWARIVITIVTFPSFVNAFADDRVHYIHGEDRRLPQDGGDDDLRWTRADREYPRTRYPPQAGGILFSTSSVYLAKLLVSSLVFSLLFIPFTAILYPIASLRGGFNYVLVFLLALILQQIAAISLGLTISAACRNRVLGQTIGSGTVVILVILSGSLYRISTVTWILRWLQFLIFSFYTNQALIHNEYIGQRYPFFPFTGERYLELLGDDVLGVWGGIGGILGLILLTNIMGLIIFHYKEERYRRRNMEIATEVQEDRVN